ncbi:uncharacterized protein LOC135158071 [Lytechinus pictus]|uniref:uncharacterized protein LOC135158071 n=1 Tax=Lytechinus pictus TaxID=7653 RepID=UPI0030BA0A54
MDEREQERNAVIKICFEMGLMYKDIVTILATECGIVISFRHLKRLLRQHGLSRRKNYSDIGEVVDFILKQVEGSGRLHGYRWMFEKCRAHHINCKKEDVRIILGVVDPEGTTQRRRRRLRRRQYSSKGPNFLWHLDSYDKLKAFGICINGCIDGFSRKIMWMNAYHTSSDPKVIGGYYIEKVSDIGGCPSVVRGDLGTENGYVRDFQRFFREDDEDGMAGIRSYLEGPSTANQRIEYWWSFLRRECMEFWIYFFRDLQDDGDFIGNFVDVNLLRFCFLHLIQAELDEVVDVWDRHLIRPSRNVQAPSGRPNIMFNLPSLYTTRDYLHGVSQERMQACKEECVFRKTIPCDEDIFELCCIVMNEVGYEYPRDRHGARLLYVALRHEITHLLNN